MDRKNELKKHESTDLIYASENGSRVNLTTPIAMPKASAFLWNKKMMIQLNCRGFAVSQYLHNDAEKYSHAPNLEIKTFMQPEQPYYAHHPGRFVYIKDEENGEIFSIPYEPVRKMPDSFVFSAGKSDIKWMIRHKNIEIEIGLNLPKEDVVELWTLTLRNSSSKTRKLNVYPFFTIGYMSWMNQSAEYSQKLGGIIASCVTPYQKLADYPKIKMRFDKTFFLHSECPASWETRREVFEGEGGLNNPDGVTQLQLSNGIARYETPTAALQYRIELKKNAEKIYHFIFGPAKDEPGIASLKKRYLSEKLFSEPVKIYCNYINDGKGCLTIETPDAHFNSFVNNWLARQIFYHGDVNRLTTDPQTRNYLQDNMGMVYIKPDVSRSAFLHALSQQESGGAMPDGILLHENAELKYINQIPHTDHCIWLPVCLQAYLDETNDVELLEVIVKSKADNSELTVFERITNSLNWLLENRDERGLSFIAQGDWCDPMNMVGHKGKGISGWLSIATIYVLKIWATVCKQKNEPALATEFLTQAQQLGKIVNTFLWDGNWFARGITDDNIAFGVSKDAEGKIFLNPQSWAILADCVDEVQVENMISAIETQLETPFGVAMLAPAYTKMREDVGRVTQKFPGSAENGSVYNHAAIFYIYSLYKISKSDRAFKLLRQMIPGNETEDYLQRGQMPIYIPNYYRGAYYQYPETAGRSSQLFNTGTVSWFYRCLIDGLFGIRGTIEGLRFEPKLPSHWEFAKVNRKFRGATFEIDYQRRENISKTRITVDDIVLADSIFREIEKNRVYSVKIEMPATIDQNPQK